MDRAIYTAMSAAYAAMMHQSVIANNLANASTAGFKAQTATFRAVLINGPTFATRALVAPSVPGNDFSTGSINTSGNNLDIALNHKYGWLAVQLSDGREAYTRNGRIKINDVGRLMVQGYPLLGVDNQPLIVPSDSNINIESDGTISLLREGDKIKNLIHIGKIKLVHIKPDSLYHDDNGLFNLTIATKKKFGAVLPTDPAQRIKIGAFECSNVSSIQAMVEMISNARNFEMQIKIISNIDNNARAANQILAIS